MSVDTYLKGKNLGRYQRVQYGDVEVLVAPALPRWAARVHLDVKKFLFWKSFEVFADHAHGPT